MVDRAVGRSGKPQSTSIDALTSQEKKVLQLIAEGRSTKEISGDLGLSTNTIQAHRKNLMAKLDIHKDTALVRFALKEGLAKL
jgi:DNA-binding NarL/FixJ family response regulator